LKHNGSIKADLRCIVRIVVDAREWPKRRDSILSCFFPCFVRHLRRRYERSSRHKCVAADAVIYFEADANWLSVLFRMVEIRPSTVGWRPVVLRRRKRRSSNARHTCPHQPVLLIGK